jgi:putative hydrolase of HD superfamily
MDEINKFRILNKLKSVYRFNSVDNRKESSAEHSWSALMLADMYMTKELDRLKVYELLMYHDVVEIEAGDTPFHPEMSRDGKKEKEEKAIKILKKQLPRKLSGKFIKLVKEFEDRKTIEARYAKAIDTLDAAIHELDYRKDWKGWTKEFLVKNKSKYFDDFPELKKAFDTIIQHLVDEKYFH